MLNCDENNAKSQCNVSSFIEVSLLQHVSILKRLFRESKPEKCMCLVKTRMFEKKLALTLTSCCCFCPTVPCSMGVPYSVVTRQTGSKRRNELSMYFSCSFGTLVRVRGHDPVERFHGTAGMGHYWTGQATRIPFCKVSLFVKTHPTNTLSLCLVSPSLFWWKENL